MKSAAARERQIKRWTAEKKGALVKGHVQRLKALSERQFAHKKMAFTWRDLLKNDA
jgi:hypothetical protein